MDDDEEFVIYINIVQKFNLKLEIQKEEVEPTDKPTDATDIPTPSDTDTISPSDTDTTAPSHNTDEQPETSSSDDFPVYAIVLISVAGFIIIVLILFFIIHAIRKKKIENFDGQESASLLKEVSDAKD